MKNICYNKIRLRNARFSIILYVLSNFVVQFQWLSRIFQLLFKNLDLSTLWRHQVHMKTTVNFTTFEPSSAFSLLNFYHVKFRQNKRTDGRTDELQPANEE